MGGAHGPVGVFALFADLAGTIRLEVVGNLFLYVILFFGGALILAFWVIPSLIAALVPIGHRELLKELNSAIVIAVVTSLPVTSVPYIVQMTERLAARCQVKDADRNEIISTTMGVSYPLRSSRSYQRWGRRSRPLTRLSSLPIGYVYP